MSKTVLANVDGYTPVIDDLLKALGLMPALVFGRVWRFCQMEDRICKASQQRIADELQISRRSVVRAIDLLVKEGYLKEIHTQTVNHYQDTGKAGMEIRVSASVTQSHSEKMDCDSVSLPECQRVTSGVTQSHLKREEKKEEKKPLSIRATNFENLSVLDYSKIPELALYQAATGTTPPAGPRGTLLRLIVKTIKEKDLHQAELETSYTKWISRGYRPDNLDGWLVEWAPAVKRGEQPWESSRSKAENQPVKGGANGNPKGKGANIWAFLEEEEQP